MATELNPGNTDSAEAFENRETAKKLPAGWLALLVALVVWGIFYTWAYSPSLGGWSQEGAYQQAAAAEKK